MKLNGHPPANGIPVGLSIVLYLVSNVRNTLVILTPHVLRVIELRKSGVAILQGSDATTISHQVSKLAHCSVPVIDTNLYPETFVRTDKVHCQRCGNRKPFATMLLCDVCNEGWHISCLEVPLDKIPPRGWVCEKHKNADVRKCWCTHKMLMYAYADVRKCWCTHKMMMYAYADVHIKCWCTHMPMYA